jgi:TctA family transporter
MNSNKVIASLCYFSIFFAGFIFPIVVYFVANDPEVKKHAKKAFLSHCIPVATIVFFVILGVFMGVAQQYSDVSFLVGGGLIWIGFAIAGVVNLVVVVWNIIKGIQVLK